MAHASETEIDSAIESLPLQNRESKRGIVLILAALRSHAGASWQERWEASGADQDGTRWRQALGDPWVGVFRKRADDEAAMGIADLIAIDAIRPSYQWLATSSPRFHRVREQRAAVFFERADAHRFVRDVRLPNFRNCVLVLTKVMIRSGLAPEHLTAEALLEYREFQLARGQKPDGLTHCWTLLIDLGVFDARAPRLRQLISGGRPGVEHLVDLYPIKSTAVRAVLIRYLRSREPHLDYSTLRWLAYELGKNFWLDIELHHPGIETLNIGLEAGRAWIARVNDGRRVNTFRTLTTVKGFYTDISAWAHEDAYWAQWAAPLFFLRDDTRGNAKQKRRVQAQIHQRIRDVGPQLPRLIASVETYRQSSARLLEVASSTPVGQSFDFEGQVYRRSLLGHMARKSYMGTERVWIEGAMYSKRVDATRLEDNAFWAWALVNTLSETGVRIEELVEITSLALSIYKLPETGEQVPLLQIVPSKSDRERVLLVSPELAHVLAEVKRRILLPSGKIPLVSRYDGAEMVFSEPLPFLFQTVQGSERRSMATAQVRRLVRGALVQSGILNSRGETPDVTPHDFRRLFATTALSAGLPIHILAKLLGHQNIATTQGYAAVYDEDTFRHFRSFLDRRRALREPDDYREPSDAEINQFHEHFEKRKVELGSCARAYGTPCIHEHACVRCPMLRPDPGQRGRLEEILENLKERKSEAERMGWFGELEGIEISLNSAREKLAKMNRAVSLGMPLGRAFTPVAEPITSAGGQKGR